MCVRAKGVEFPLEERAEMGRMKWTESKGATERALRLLEESGALLEQRVSNECLEFVRATHKKRGLRVSSDSVTYGLDTQQDPLRQIDQCVGIYKEFILDNSTGVAFRLEIPIEAKSRRDVEVVGIDYAQDSYRPRMPITGFMQGSLLSGAVVDLLPFSTLPLLHPVLMEITDGSTPKKIVDENLVYKAGSAIYDFIRFEIQPESNESEAPADGSAEESTIIKKMGLVSRFEKYLAENHYVWWGVINSWMRSNLSDALATEFVRRLPAGRLYYGMDACFPILCINGPLWRYSGPKILECNALLTRVRVRGWPGRLRQQLLRYTAEAPLIVTNPKGLMSLLQEASRWFLKVEERLKCADKRTKQRWQLESSFYREALKHFMHGKPEKEIRSDLDVFDIMQRF